MKTRMVTILAVLILTTTSAIAYDKELDEQKIHEAYVLGRRNDKATGDFLDAYSAQITEPQNGPHIAQIELLTPYAQIVDLSRRKATDGYTETQAVQDFKAHGKTLKLNILVMLPAAYPKPADSTEARLPATRTEKQAMAPENFWQNFEFHLKQNGKSIPSGSINNRPIHSTATSTTPAVLDGENVWIEFDAKDVSSDFTTVEVITPEGKTIKGSFDLKKLR
ncbi:MAG: hypothetical protein ABLQ96_03390 [Candidatus Acidiferrum sp.]